MTKQEYLDLLVATSKAGKFPARQGGKCRYRTTNGERSCPVGLLIPDEMYTPIMENRNSYALAIAFPEIESVYPDGMTERDIRNVQLIHDRLDVWDHDAFVAHLLALPCFSGMTPTAA